jgi:hypothetical protein
VHSSFSETIVSIFLATEVVCDDNHNYSPLLIIGKGVPGVAFQRWHSQG